MISLKKITDKDKKYIFFSLLFIGIIGASVSILAYSPLSPVSFNEESMVISSGDVIRNFRVDSFNDQPVGDGGTVLGLGSKLKFEVGSAWTTTKDDLQMLSVSQVGDKVYMSYKVTFKNKVNIYTNVKLQDAVATGISLDGTIEKFRAGSYRHYGCYGGAPHIAWDSDLKWNHLNVGNIRDHNTKNNVFTGDVGMSFDIDQSPLPNTLTDSNGNPATKEFDYIAVNSVFIGSSTNGLLSNDVPEITGLTPAAYETSKNSKSGGSRAGIAGGYEAKWNPRASLSGSRKLSTFDIGVTPQSVGSSMSPRTKSNGAIWTAKSEKSMADCKFTYGLSSLSPLVTEYGSTLTYYKQSLSTQDFLASLIPFVWSVKVNSDTEKRISETRTTALHVTNRYIQTEIKVVFDLYTSYTVEVEDEDPYDGLEKPQEYYDDLAFDATVDGFGGASQYRDITSFSLLGLDFLTSIILIMVGVGFIAIVGIVAYRNYQKKKLVGMISKAQNPNKI